TEQAIAKVWGEVLSVERVGLEDNFFSLGGDSILSIRVVALLKRQGIFVTIGDIFTHQTVSKLAAFYKSKNVDEMIDVAEVAAFELLDETERAEIEALIEAEGREIEDAYPLSTLQAGMVFHTQLAEFSGVYHDIVNEHIVCPWDDMLFGQALSDCIEAHPILRTCFRLNGKRSLQLVYRHVETPLVVEDIRHMEQSEQDEYLSQWIESHKAHVFDWARGPLFQVNIFNRTDESFVFALSFHHSLLDGWSRASLSTRLYNRYQQLLQGRTPEPLVQEHIYREYIALEQKALVNEAAKEYFAEMLKDAPGMQLPVKQLEHSELQQRKRFGEYPVRDFKVRSEQLKKLASDLGVPLQAMLQALLIKVLQSFSGEPTVMVNVVINGRPEIEGGEQGIGLFLNSLPMVVRPVHGSWRELIKEVLQASNNSMSFRHYPLAQISQDSGLSFDEVIFNYTHFHVFDQIKVDAMGEELALLDSSGFEQTNYGLTVDIQRTGADDSLNLHLSYDRARFDDETMVSFGEYFIRAADAMLADVDCFELNLLSEKELKLLLVTHNQTACEYPADKTIHALFEVQASTNADAIAVEFGTHRLTYAELNQKANALASYLLEHCELGQDVLVGICQERSIDMVVSILAVLKAGGAYLPLDPHYPQERINYMLQDAAPVAVLTSKVLAAKVAHLTTICVDSDQLQAQLSESKTTELPQVSTSALAYVIYTSGSTGKPKGVMVEHAHVVNYLHHATTQYYSEVTAAVVSSSLAFDATVTSLLTALVAGKCLHLLSEDKTAEMDALADKLKCSDTTLLFKLTPSHLEGLAQRLSSEQGEAISAQPHRLIVGGEQLRRAVAELWTQKLLPNCLMINEYGPTETVVGCSTFRVGNSVTETGRFVVPIGLPTANMQLYVLGSNLRPVGINVPGELYIGGVSVARGYLNRPDLSAERFIDNPFYQQGQPQWAKRLYRTGDQVKWLNQGGLVYLGRLDEQVKIRGFRIETGEIEHAITAYDGVKDCRLILATLPSGTDGLVAYIVAPEVGGEQESHFRDALRLHLSSQLPEYMIPAAFMLLDELPLTVNGKLDRKALPLPDLSGQQRIYVAPNTSTEEAICAVWQNLLGLERVGIYDNFFELGGHSLLVMQVIARLQDIGIVMDVRQLFTAPIVADLAVLIDNHGVQEAFTAPENLIETLNSYILADVTIDDFQEKSAD
ncbi:amino acid adenylation domain-containing protein, partial [Rheinheimera soli]